MKEFKQQDVIYNTIRTFPEIEFFIYRNIYLNNERGTEPTTPLGQKNLYELNTNRTGSWSSLIYPYVVKGSSLNAFKSVSTSSFYDSTVYGYGDLITGSYPTTAGITVEQYSGSTRPKVVALKNILNYNRSRSQHFIYSGNIGSGSSCNKGTQELTLISVPSIFYGGQIKPGTIDFNFYITGTLIGRLQDTKRNGELIETTGSSTGSVAGLALYNEGIFLMTGSWSLHASHTEDYRLNSGSVSPAWKFFGVTGSGGNFPVSSSFEMKFSGIQPVEHVTMMTHVGVGEANYSSNPTFITYDTASSPYKVGAKNFKENPNLTIANITKSPHTNYSASFEKQTYISKVILYDENKNIIGIAKLARPLRKKEADQYMIKLSLDF